MDADGVVFSCPRCRSNQVFTTDGRRYKQYRCSGCGWHFRAWQLGPAVETPPQPIAEAAAPEQQRPAARQNASAAEQSDTTADSPKPGNDAAAATPAPPAAAQRERPQPRPQPARVFELPPARFP